MDRGREPKTYFPRLPCVVALGALPAVGQLVVHDSVGIFHLVSTAGMTEVQKLSSVKVWNFLILNYVRIVPGGQTIAWDRKRPSSDFSETPSKQERLHLSR